ncbi:MAG: hypothetical protein FRX49_07171 [Trebouxia sp. A1-2]|nr:MAG: hypothetical protein FRX49_07171 [Trebouxia sp. A1-2]
MTAQVTAAPFDTQTSLNLRAIACSKRFKEDYSGWDPAAENLLSERRKLRTTAALRTCSTRRRTAPSKKGSSSLNGICTFTNSALLGTLEAYYALDCQAHQPPPLLRCSFHGVQQLQAAHLIWKQTDVGQWLGETQQWWKPGWLRLVKAARRLRWLSRRGNRGKEVQQTGLWFKTDFGKGETKEGHKGLEQHGTVQFVSQGLFTPEWEQVQQDDGIATEQSRGGKGGEEVQQGDRVAAGGHAHLGQPLIKLPPAKQVRNHCESFSKLVDICQRLCLLIKRHGSQLMNAITASRCHKDVPT